MALAVLSALFALVLASCGNDGGRQPGDTFSRQLVAIVDPLYVTGEGATLEIFVRSCNGSPTVEFVEESETVWIEVTTEVGNADDCNDIAVVVLDKPLAGRQVKDRVSGEVLTLEFVNPYVESEPLAWP